MNRAKSASSSKVQSVLDWIHKGYPEGIPYTDYYPLLALLARTLDEDAVVTATWAILKESHPESPVTEQQIRQAVQAVIAKEPNINEINQVAARLALVGWPLADHG
ncbi:DUF3349 domain-containing protein [Mycolicibacterium sp.]|uniref:DUF3349 domain-containing protein n=1 Tax=Mycolicibacterium sp. TaxID=2320850 RepID=UPI0028A794F7|nr:DUF3349 domain-containing protein [Mycolicibacterium sp.]